MSLASKIKQLLDRVPGLGRMIRLKRNLEQIPILQQHVLGRVATLHDQMLAQPNLWAPIAEQVWEAQAAGAQIVADDLRNALQQVRREQAQLAEAIQRRLDRLEERLMTEQNA